MRHSLNHLQELVLVTLRYSMDQNGSTSERIFAECASCNQEVEPVRKCQCPNRREDGSWDFSNAAYTPKKKENDTQNTDGNTGAEAVPGNG